MFILLSLTFIFSCEAFFKLTFTKKYLEASHGKYARLDILVILNLVLVWVAYSTYNSCLSSKIKSDDILLEWGEQT